MKVYIERFKYGFGILIVTMTEKRKNSKLIRVSTETEKLLNNFRSAKGDEDKPSYNDAIIKLWNDRNKLAEQVNKIRKVMGDFNGVGEADNKNLSN